MIRIAIIITSISIAACSGNQPKINPENAAIHCHIEGTVHNRPDSDKLLLFVGIGGYTAQSTKPYSEIDIKNGKFSCDIYIDGNLSGLLIRATQNRAVCKGNNPSHTELTVLSSTSGTTLNIHSTIVGSVREATTCYTVSKNASTVK